MLRWKEIEKSKREAGWKRLNLVPSKPMAEVLRYRRERLKKESEEREKNKVTRLDLESINEAKVDPVPLNENHIRQKKMVP